MDVNQEGSVARTCSDDINDEEGQSKTDREPIEEVSIANQPGVKTPPIHPPVQQPADGDNATVPVLDKQTEELNTRELQQNGSQNIVFGEAGNEVNASSNPEPQLPEETYGEPPSEGHMISASNPSDPDNKVPTQTETADDLSLTTNQNNLEGTQNMPSASQSKPLSQDQAPGQSEPQQNNLENPELSKTSNIKDSPRSDSENQVPRHEPRSNPGSQPNSSRVSAASSKASLPAWQKNSYMQPRNANGMSQSNGDARRSMPTGMRYGNVRRKPTFKKVSKQDDEGPQPPWGGPTVLPPITNSRGSLQRSQDDQKSDSSPVIVQNGMVKRTHIPPLSIRLKLQVLLSSRELCYRESTWTKRRIEKLQTLGFDQADPVSKTRRVVEERRWSLLLDELLNEPELVTLFWNYLKAEFPVLHEQLEAMYQRKLRAYYKPTLADLQSTHTNHQRMREILVVITDQYDQELAKVEEISQERKEEIQHAKAKLSKYRTELLDLAWAEGLDKKTEAQKPNPEEVETETLDKVSTDLMQLFLTIIQAKNEQVDTLTSDKEELQRKSSGLKKTLDDRTRQLNQRVSIGTETELELTGKKPERVTGRSIPGSRPRVTPRAGPYRNKKPVTYPAKPA